MSHHFQNFRRNLNVEINDEINVVEWFRVKSPSFAICKEGDLPLLNFSNLTCMHLYM